jgi:hypothetical protein
MATPGTGNRDAVSAANDASTAGDHKADPYKDVVEAERAQSPEFEKSGQNYSKMDKELAAYVSDTRIEISPEEDTRLRRLIDKRVLAIMITTYFLQAIDKGTLSFASIMGIVEDTNLQGQEVRPLISYPPRTPFLSIPLTLSPTSTNGSPPASTSPSSSSSTRKTG